MTTSKTPRLRLVEPSTQSDEEPDETRRPLEVTVQSGTDIGGPALVLLAGEIDDTAAARLRDIIGKLVSEGRRYIIVDLDDLTSLDAQAYEDQLPGACSAVQRTSDAAVLLTSDPRCMLMLKVADDAP